MDDLYHHFDDGNNIERIVLGGTVMSLLAMRRKISLLSHQDICCIVLAAVSVNIHDEGFASGKHAVAITPFLGGPDPLSQSLFSSDKSPFHPLSEQIDICGALYRDNRLDGGHGALAVSQIVGRGNVGKLIAECGIIFRSDDP